MDPLSVLPTSATRIESEAVLKLGLSRIAGPSLAHARLVSPWRTQLLIALHRYSPGREYDGNEYVLLTAAINSSEPDHYLTQPRSDGAATECIR